MRVETIFWAGIALMALNRSRQLAQVQQSQSAKMNDPTNWGADQWTRLYAADIAAVGGPNRTQSSLTAYGLTGTVDYYPGSAVQ
ncbi:hypothetical protein [Duganella qianjiadongensis]|uniref:Uncharacterized protein n=1 Tax=Duganella qianjiadongensis TaxID=2692176 RepID=A0ABW9VJ99_9BURK|nr:hypothetical protein [Duganella qianjiadongensis]MYM39664.1 hypothetical protein [Duganella qianjiadongensis]